MRRYRRYSQDRALGDLTGALTRLYGHDLGDLFAFSFLGGLRNVDERALSQQIAFIKDQVFHQPELFDLAIETEGLRANMLSASQPQYYFCLEKTRADGL